MSPEVSHVGIGALARLENLQQFLFKDLSEELPLQQQQLHQRQLQPMKLCGQLLPRLEMSGRCFDVDSLLDDVCFSLHDEVVQLQLELQLQQIVLGGDSRPDAACRLPKLDELLLVRPTGDVSGMCQRFDRVTSLSLTGATMDVVCSVLDSIGHRLDTLALVQTTPQLVLHEAIGRCPRLTSLTIKNTTQYEHWFLPYGSLGCLEQINLGMNSKNANFGFFIRVKICLCSS